MQSAGLRFSMVPAIRRLYPENNDARKQARSKRHPSSNTLSVTLVAPVLGVTGNGRKARNGGRD